MTVDDLKEKIPKESLLTRFGGVCDFNSREFLKEHFKAANKPIPDWLERDLLPPTPLDHVRQRIHSVTGEIC